MINLKYLHRVHTLQYTMYVVPYHAFPHKVNKNSVFRNRNIPVRTAFARPKNLVGNPHKKEEIIL
jgi:hypothetical protein